MNTAKTFASLALPLVAASSVVFAAKNNEKSPACAATAPVECNADACCRTFCMGPENYGVNAAVNPVTCNGDWVLNLAGFYWNAHQEGLEYAIVNDQFELDWRTTCSYVRASTIAPDFKWDLGFKLGLAYDTTCDGWDFGATWTWYEGKAGSSYSADVSDNNILMAYLSNYGDPQIFPLATEGNAHWKLQLNLVDLELGRNFWNSKRLALRPFIGLRFASLKQKYDVGYTGNDFRSRPNVGILSTPQNDFIETKNEFEGVGVRGGLNSVWNLGCGWGLFGNLALSIVYGKFDVEMEEYTRSAQSPYTKTNYTELSRNFRASRLMSDLALGVQWSALFCDCQYGLTLALGWEHHLFLNQNQLYRINHQFNSLSATDHIYTPDISPLHGDLDTQGWTFSVKFDF